MNAPFKSVGIIFFVTIVHVVAIAFYASRTRPEATSQRSIVIPDVDSLEVMPEQLVGGFSGQSAGDEPESCLECLEEGVLVESDIVKEDTAVGAKPGNTGPLEREKRDGVSKDGLNNTVVKADEAPTITAQRWEENDLSKRVSSPYLDGIIGRKSGALAENRPVPAAKAESKTTTKEDAPRVRSFSPIPRS